MRRGVIIFVAPTYPSQSSLHGISVVHSEVKAALHLQRLHDHGLNVCSMGHLMLTPGSPTTVRVSGDTGFIINYVPFFSMLSRLYLTSGFQTVL